MPGQSVSPTPSRVRIGIDYTATQSSGQRSGYLLLGTQIPLVSLRSSNLNYLWTNGSSMIYRRGLLLLGLGGVLGLGSSGRTGRVGLAVSVASTAGEDKFAGTALYPPSPPLEEGMLRVSELHSLYYAVYGCPEGEPALVVHGGPGGGTSPAMARYFDPHRYRVVLVDQRGAGKSQPSACIEDNTTQALVRDFELVRERLGIDRWLVFGGSWGSTLSLAYAVSLPTAPSSRR